MTELHIDFETRSAVDLKEVGLHNYASHPSTDAWCMAYAFDDEPVQLWERGQPIPPQVALHVAMGETVIAHNAAFELAIWAHIMCFRYRWPDLAPEQCQDTMVMAYAMALPGALERVAPALGLAHAKDMAGHRLMLQMSRPREIAEDGTVTWWDDSEKLEKLYAYCRNDVEVERAVATRLMQLSPREHALWVLDQTINNRGVFVDRAAVRAAIAVVQREQDRLNDGIRNATDNAVGFCTEVAGITKWIRGQGVPIPGIAKADVLDALALDDLPPAVRAVLLLRQEAGKTSTAKLQAMLDAASADGRLRGMFQFHGAGTGRWAGRRVQLHNLPRPKLKHAEIEQAVDVLTRMEPAQAAQYLSLFHDKPLDVISWSLRALLKAAPGRDLLAADYSNIEGRAVAWLAGCERKLERFRAFDAGTGPDIYVALAAEILGLTIEEVTDAMRQAYGKVPELACGYQGGVGAFQMMAKTYGVKVSDVEAEKIKTRWREAHPEIVSYWYDIEDAAIRAVLNPGAACSVGPRGREVTFRMVGSFLWCKLPSDRVLCYPYPKLKPILTPWGAMKDCLHYMSVNGMTNKWEETHTYGGKLTENVTQAICRDLLAHGMTAAENAGYAVVLHVHDEVVSEVEKDFGNLKEFEQLCASTEAWAAGLPVVAKGWRGERYRK